MKGKFASLLRAAVSAEAYARLADAWAAWRNFIPALLLRGRRYECPLCCGRFRRLRPCGKDVPVLKELQVVGAGKRVRGACPGCGATDRERLVYLYLRERTDLFSRPQALLHVAPERMLQRVLRRQSTIRYIAADLNSPRAQVKMDISAMDCADGCFDAILCCHVLEHVADDRRALRELHRVLRPGGWAILQVPLAMGLAKTIEEKEPLSMREREARFGQRDHLRLYGRDFRARLEQAGFRVSEFDFGGENGAVAADRYGLCREEKLFVAAKP